MHVQACSRLSPSSHVCLSIGSEWRHPQRRQWSPPPLRCVLTRSAARSDTRWRQLSWPRAPDSFLYIFMRLCSRQSCASVLAHPCYLWNIVILMKYMGRQEGAPHLDHTLPHRDASVGAAADMRTCHPAAHEWRAQTRSQCWRECVCFQRRYFLCCARPVAPLARPRWHSCARWSHRDKRKIIIRN